MNQVEQLVIVGSGPAGLTAALYAARANTQPLVIEGPTPGGQLMGTTLVENWPGETSILGPDLIQKLRQHAQKFGVRFSSATLTNLEPSKNPFVLTTTSGTVQAKAVILAMGATPKRLNCPGESDYWGKGVTVCAVCDGALYANKKVFVIGGGDTAMEDASFLLKYTKSVTIVQLLDKLTASHAMQQRIINNPDVTIMYNSTVTTIHGDGNTITALTIRNTKTNTETNHPANGMFIAIGLRPQTEILKNKLELSPTNYVITHENTQTSIKGIFAAGDIVDYKYRQAITAAGTGCQAALDAERYLQALQ